MIKSLNKKVTGATTSAALGPVPTGKEWVIKMVVVTITTSGGAAPTELEIDGVKISESASISSLRDLGFLLAGPGTLPAGSEIPDIAFATDGQAVDVLRKAGGGFTWSVHMSYLERDIPT